VIVIADSSPLIYLSRVGALDILRLLYGEVLVPSVVWTEVVGMRPNAPGAEAVRAATWLRIPDVEPDPVDLGLDPGESAAILLAEALHADLLLIDERAGRAVAEARGVRVRGTVGVLVLGCRAGHLALLKPMLDALVSEGFRIAPGLVTQALRDVGEDRQ
jgi:predicted nucleic acid-binding protein